jgi:hypothetical protein
VKNTVDVETRLWYFRPSTSALRKKLPQIFRVIGLAGEATTQADDGDWDTWIHGGQVHWCVMSPKTLINVGRQQIRPAVRGELAAGRLLKLLTVVQSVSTVTETEAILHAAIRVCLDTQDIKRFVPWNPSAGRNAMLRRRVASRMHLWH